MTIIDGKNLKLGRLASNVAKRALEGEEIIIINSEKCVVTGNKKSVIKDKREMRQIGTRYKGPFLPKRADRIVKRAIRGMLPYKRKRGREAMARIRTHIGIPEEFVEQAKNAETVEEADLGVVLKKNYITIERLSREEGYE
ncbi:MAG: 50S ribosomal protein L13 [archaeon]|jgi:large subunit ribosomal protein L13|nr:50S ribosomal protein L13 [Euryarchaeota archaeon]MDP7260395.1 50S ribosomal protein L13 [archaeon]|tara:strand:- start:53348 stop:53770 length:423 start_codon:yes stop_codon:yes gene_type:complete